MIPTAIGVTCKPANQDWSDVMQRWLEQHGLGVYLPQRINGESANLSVEYDPVTKGLKWKNTTLAHLSALPLGSMVMSYNGYFRGQDGKDTWETVNFPDPADPQKRLTQDDLTAEQLAVYFRNIVGYLALKNIKGYVFMDEPPHKSSNKTKPGEYGWTPQTEMRDVKWATACVLAGLTIRIAVPGPSQLRYWVPRMPQGVRWVLHEKSDPYLYAPLLPTGTDVWIYNVRASTLPKLTARMEAFAAAGLPVTGLVMWNAVPWVHDNEMPLLFDLSGPSPVPTDALWTLLQQLGAYNVPDLSDSARLSRLEADMALVKRHLGL